MRTQIGFTLLQGLVLVGVLTQIACAGGGAKSPSSGPAVTTPSMSVNIVGVPTDASCGEAVPVNAQVVGAPSTDVAWSVDGIVNGNSDVGTITGTGDAAIYTAPASEGTHTLAATSVADTSKSAYTSLSIHYHRLAVPTIIAPASASAGSTGLTASVAYPQGSVTYTWSIAGGTLTGATKGTATTFSAGQPGVLTLTCTAVLGTQSTRATAQVQVLGSLPAVPQISVPSSVTTGSSGIVASVLQPQGSTSYGWAIQDGTLTAGANSSSATFTAGAAGTLTLTCSATNTVGSVNGTALVQVVPSAPVTPVITAPSQVDALSANSASVPAQAGCTTTWTLTGGTITAGQNTTNLSFTAGGVGTMLLGCTVTNSASVAVSAQKSIAVLAAPAPAPAPGFYGSGINADDLGNQIIGWNTANDVCNRKGSIRVRAQYTSTLVSIRPKFIWSLVKGGYGAGNGGNILIQIQSDDGSSNHLPSGTVLASLQYDQPITIGNYWPMLTFSTPASLTAGQLYHIVFSNVAADPTVNYVSLDHLYKWNVLSQEQPQFPNTDLCPLETTTSGSWVKFVRGSSHSYTPTIELDYGNGASQGQGYIQGFGQTSSGWNPKTISGTQSVRETFTVSGANRTVSSVAVRLNRVSGSSPLTVTVEKSDGTLIGQGTVLVTMGAASTTSANESWATVTFTTPLTLQSGTGYHLVLSCPSDTIHTTHTLEKGILEGYKATTYFADGYAQYTTGAGWLGWNEWGGGSRTDNDLQFYFTTQ